MRKGRKKITKIAKGLILILLLIAFLSSVFLTTNIVYAENFVVQQLTSTYASKIIKDIDGDKFVWEDNNLDNGRQIMLYDGSAIRQLTFDEYPLRNVDSRIDGDYVVWVKEDGLAGSTFTSQVFVYRISTSELIQVTNDSQYEKHSPNIANNKIVWSSRQDNFPSEIALYDLNTSQLEFITNDSFEDQIPVISENIVSWVQTQGGGQQDYEVYMKDLTSGEIRRLTDNNFNENKPQVSGDYVAWDGFDGNDFEIYLYDGNQIRQITNNNTNEHQFSLSGDKLVWTLNDMTGEGDFIAVYTISSQTVEVIADGFAPKTDGQRIVWLKSFDKPEINASSRDIFTKNLLTGEITQVTTDAFVSEDYVFASGDLIAWVGEPRNPYTGMNVFIASLFEGNTPTGSNVVVSQNNIILSYSQVDSAGNTTVINSSTGAHPPAGFKLGSPSTYYFIETTAQFSGIVGVCISYDENTIVGNENKLRLMHFVENQGWVDSTTSLDTTNNLICGSVTSFSDFAIMTEPTIQDLITRVEQMNLQQGIQNSLDSKLETAQEALESKNSGDISSAINKLNAFNNEVEAQRGSKLTNEQADELYLFYVNLTKIINGIKQF